MAKCNVTGCDRPSRSRGWCRTHYQRWYIHGDADADAGTPIHPQGFAIPFLEAVLAGDPTDDCVIWPFCCNSAGYGAVKREGRQQPAHRVMLIMIGGDRPGLDALHAPVICHTPSCVNPRHLRWGTQKENEADKLLDGTMPDFKGERSGMAKLTEPDVLAISEAARNGETQRSVAARFKVNQSTISRIVNRQRWRHI